jgi:hypothetical protein
MGTKLWTLNLSASLQPSAAARAKVFFLGRALCDPTGDEEQHRVVGPFLGDLHGLPVGVRLRRGQKPICILPAHTTMNGQYLNCAEAFDPRRVHLVVPGCGSCFMLKVVANCKSQSKLCHRVRCFALQCSSVATHRPPPPLVIELLSCCF